MVVASHARYVGDDRKTHTGREVVFINCPGCKYLHSFVVALPPGEVHHPQDNPLWTWNKDLEKPTFTPSLLTSGSDPKHRCHSYVTDGNIQFLNDSYHALRGQTVPLPEWENG